MPICYFENDGRVTWCLRGSGLIVLLCDTTACWESTTSRGWSAPRKLAVTVVGHMESQISVRLVVDASSSRGTGLPYLVGPKAWGGGQNKSGILSVRESWRMTDPKQPLPPDWPPFICFSFPPQIHLAPKRHFLHFLLSPMPFLLAQCTLCGSLSETDSTYSCVDLLSTRVWLVNCDAFRF